LELNLSTQGCENAADSLRWVNHLKIVLGLLLRVLCDLLGVGIWLQLVDSFVEALRLSPSTMTSVRDRADVPRFSKASGKTKKIRC